MTDMITLKGLPAAPDAERFVLGAILIEEVLLSTVSEIIQREDFSLQAHRVIWDAIQRLHERGMRIDRVTVATELENMGQLMEVGGITALCNLDDGMPKLENVSSYAEIVNAKAIRRRAIMACQATIDGLMGGEDTPEILEHAHNTLTRLAEQSTRTGDLMSVGQFIENLGVERLMAPRAKASGAVLLHWESLRGVITCLSPGQLILWAARPACGKSVVAAQQALCAAEAGHPVAFFSLEMKPEALIRRMACSIASVNSYLVDSGMIASVEHREDRHALNRAVGYISGLPIYFGTQFETTVPAIKAKCRRLKATKGLGLIVIDYLQLVGAVGRFTNANERVSSISRGLKLLAGELEVPVVALSQLTRDNDRADRPPKLSDLRDSGSLEQDADIVVFNHVPKDDKTQGPVDVQFIVAKQREGAVRKRVLLFERQFTRIVDLGEEYGR